MKARKQNRSNGAVSHKQKGRRFSAEEKARALTLLEAGMEQERVAEVIGASTQSLRRWMDKASSVKASANGTSSQELLHSETSSTDEAEQTSKSKTSGSKYAPRDPGQGLAPHEVEAILELKKKHPSMGPAQIRTQLKRFKGWRIARKAIAQVLKRHGYETVHTSSRPKGEKLTRFEAPRRNALWQIDFTEVRVHKERLHVLVVLDDFSRFIVGHALSESPSSEVATETVKAAIARHGKPEAIRSDRGGAFMASSKDGTFGRYLEVELIDHVVGRSYHPQGGGKVEAVIGTLKRELWDVEQFADRDEANKKLDAFFEHYNHRRAHMAIDGLTPADRYFGRADKVLAAIDAISRKRNSVHGLRLPAGAAMEEAGLDGEAPVEVLRLVIVEGVMELRFCGARVELGAVTD